MKSRDKGLRRKQDKAELRREEVKRLYGLGERQEEIAAQLGTTQATISRDLDKIRDRWINADPDTTRIERGKLAARLEGMLSIYFPLATRPNERGVYNYKAVDASLKVMREIAILFGVKEDAKEAKGGKIDLKALREMAALFQAREGQ